MKPHDQDRLLIVAISVLCLAALAYCGLVMLSFLANKGMTFKDFDGAAWTQAIGSVVAIAAGAAGIWWQAHHSARSAWRQQNRRQRYELKAAMLATLSIQRELAEGIAALVDVDTYAKYVVAPATVRLRKRTADLLGAVDRRSLAGLQIQNAMLDAMDVHAELDSRMAGVRDELAAGLFTEERRIDLFDGYTRNFGEMLNVMTKTQASLGRVLEKPGDEDL